MDNIKGEALDLNKSRAEFEAWAEGKHLSTRRTTTEAHGIYIEESTRDAWEVWRAALARAGIAAAQEGAGEVDAKDAVLADARKWIVKNRPAITLSRQATIDEYLYLLKKIDAAIAAQPKDTTDTRRDA